MSETQEQPNYLFGVVLPKLEPIAWGLAAFGFVLRWLAYPGGAMMLVIGLATLAQLCFLRAFKPLENPSTALWTPAPRAANPPSFLHAALLPKILGIAQAMTLIGVLFKLMFWPGSQPALVVGTLTLATAVLAQAATQQHLDQRALVVLLLGGLSLYVSSERLARQFYPHDPAKARHILEQLAHPPRRQPR